MVKKIDQTPSDSTPMQPNPKSDKKKVISATNLISQQFTRCLSLLKAHSPRKTQSLKTHSFQENIKSQTSKKVENFLNSE